MNKFSDIQNIVSEYRKNFRMKSYEEYDLDDFFIAGSILYHIACSVGVEDMSTVYDSDFMAAVTDNIQERYEDIVENLKDGDFWHLYIEDQKLPYTYLIFREAIRNANKICPDIRVTNYKNHYYTKAILEQYKILLKNI